MTSRDFSTPAAVEDGESLFVAQLESIERAIRFVCRRSGLQHGDAEDFASHVKLKLIENDYAIVRRFEGRCTFASYISVVVQRMLLDYRNHLWGKWHASAEAKRLGPAAIALEAMLHRDGLTLDEALPTLRRTDPSITRAAAEKLVSQLPQRSPRPRPVELEEAGAAELPAPADLDRSPAPERDRTALSRRLGSVVRGAVETLPESERLLFRLRFEAGMSIADIARTLQLEQKPLYRRVDALLGAFRKRLEAAGIKADEAAALIGDPAADLDFGFENEPPRPSRKKGPEPESEEAW